MVHVDNQAYLTPPGNEAKKVFTCFFCDEDIYEGDEYYCFDGADVCENCLEDYFKCIAERPDFDDDQADFEHDNLGSEGEF